MGMIYRMSSDADHPKDQQEDCAAKHSNDGEVAGEMCLRVGSFEFLGEGVVKGERSDRGRGGRVFEGGLGVHDCGC